MFEFEKSRVPNALRHIYAMFTVMVGWVIFRSDSLLDASRYLGCMFNFLEHGFYNEYTCMFLKEYWIYLIAALIFSMPVAGIVNRYMTKGILVFHRIETEPPYEEHAVYAEAPFVRLGQHRLSGRHDHAVRSLHHISGQGQL